LASTIQATEQLREQIRLRADELNRSQPLHPAPEVGAEVETEEEAALWVPQCPAPERLWQVYRGRGGDTMVSSAFEAAHEDLAAIRLHFSPVSI
jgi:hypothetical protein